MADDVVDHQFVVRILTRWRVYELHPQNVLGAQLLHFR